VVDMAGSRQRMPSNTWDLATVGCADRHSPAVTSLIALASRALYT